MTIKLGTQGERSVGAAQAAAHRAAQDTNDYAEHSGPGPWVMGATTLVGDKVYDADDEYLGTIEEIMLDTVGGRIAYAVLSFGGVFGLGSKLFAIPWNALELDAENKHFVLRLAKKQLDKAPGFDKDHWPAMADSTWAYAIHEFYETKPYWAR